MVPDNSVGVGGTIIEELRDSPHCGHHGGGLVCGDAADGGEHSTIQSAGIIEEGTNAQIFHPSGPGWGYYRALRFFGGIHRQGCPGMGQC
jgi:hypothetical protein